MTYSQLAEMAKKAQKSAYVPYSGFAVGAALLCTDGSVFLGCNIENAAYTPTVCAERVAFFKAVSEGKRDFQAIAVVGGKNHEPGELCAPCGVCRQVMAEFCSPDAFDVLLVTSKDYEVVKLGQLLPYGFTSKNLDK